MSPITITQNISAAVKFLRDGRLVAFPTGTSYGLAADTMQGWALQRLRNLKQRPSEKTFTVFMRENLYSEFLKLTSAELELLQKMANRPLTVLVKAGKDLQHLAQDGLIGVRIIDDLLMQQLAEAINVPLTATSANKSGQPPCFSPEEIQRAFSNPLPDGLLQEEHPRGASGTTYDLSLAAILDGGFLPTKKPTTIAKVVGGTIKIIRLGEVTEEQLRL